MTSLRLADLGYRGPAEIDGRVAEIVALAELGFELYPCWGIGNNGCDCGKAHKDPKEWGKHPARGAATNLVTSKPDLARKWWAENWNDNVGANPMAMGAVVIDVDPRSGGHRSWPALLEELGMSAPITVTTITGEYSVGGSMRIRGHHYWFKAPEDSKYLANLDSLGYGGIDVKHNGGVLVPPSRHSSGVQYSWLQGRSPYEVQMVPIPEALNRLIQRPQFQNPKPREQVVGYRVPPTRDSRSVRALLGEHLYEGGRAVGLYRLACRLAFRLGVETESKANVVRELLLDYNNSKVHPPLEWAAPDNAGYQIERAIQFVRWSRDAIA